MTMLFSCYCVPYRYEIREDRRREVLRAETHLETLRNDIIIAVRNGIVGNTKQPSNNYAKQHVIWDGDFSQPGPMTNNLNLQSEDIAQPNPVEDHHSTQRRFKETLLRNLENISHGHRPGNFTSAKVESYLSHLGDSVTSQSTETCPLPNLTSDPYQSHAGEVYVPKATSYGYRLSTETEEPTIQMETSFNQSRNKIISQDDLELIKLEIITSLKSELRDKARDVTTEMLNPSPATNMLPDLYSELYQTHLYTQL